MELFNAHAVSDETSAQLYQALLQGLYVTAASIMAMADQGPAARLGIGVDHYSG
jgi:hypothetical protein